MQTNVQLLPIESIGFITGALRSHEIDSESVVTRAKDLEENGMLNIPTAFRLSNGLTVIGDGATRFRAAQNLQDRNSTILNVPAGFFPVNLVDKSDSPEFDDVDVLLTQISGNATVEVTDNKRYVDGIYAVQMKYNYDNTTLAKKIGISEAQLCRRLKTVRLPAEIREEIEKTISFTNAVELSAVLGKATNAKVYGEDTTVADNLVEAARKQTIEEFKKTVADFLLRNEEDKKAVAKSDSPREPEFTPSERIMSKDELIALRAEIQIEGNDVQQELMNRIFSVDVVSVNKQRAAWQEKQDKIKADREARKAASKNAKDLSKEELQALLAAHEA